MNKKRSLLPSVLLSLLTGGCTTPAYHPPANAGSQTAQLTLVGKYRQQGEGLAVVASFFKPDDIQFSFFKEVDGKCPGTTNGLFTSVVVGYRGAISVSYDHPRTTIPVEAGQPIYIKAMYGQPPACGNTIRTTLEAGRSYIFTFDASELPSPHCSLHFAEEVKKDNGETGDAPVFGTTAGKIKDICPLQRDQNNEAQGLEKKFREE